MPCLLKNLIILRTGQRPIGLFLLHIPGLCWIVNCIFSIFSIFLHILIIVIMMTVMKVLISFLPDIGWPWDLFTVSGYFLVLFMCSVPWQFALHAVDMIKRTSIDTRHTQPWYIPSQSHYLSALQIEGWLSLLIQSRLCWNEAGLKPC